MTTDKTDPTPGTARASRRRTAPTPSGAPDLDARAREPRPKQAAKPAKRRERLRDVIEREMRDALEHERPIVCNCTRCGSPDARIYPESVAARLGLGKDAFKGVCLCPQCSFRQPIDVASLEWAVRGRHIAGCAECREAAVALGSPMFTPTEMLAGAAEHGEAVGK